MLHTVRAEIAFTIGLGLTVMVKFNGVPLQVILLLMNCGVTFIVDVNTVFPLLIVRKEGILPLPEAPKPIEPAELFVQT